MLVEKEHGEGASAYEPAPSPSPRSSFTHTSVSQSTNSVLVGEETGEDASACSAHTLPVPTILTRMHTALVSPHPPRPHAPCSHVHTGPLVFATPPYDLVCSECYGGGLVSGTTAFADFM